MFERESAVDFDSCFGVLAMEKILYDNGFEILDTPLDEDYIYQNMFDSFQNCADEMYMDCDEETETEMFYFFSSYLTRYIKLAHEYGKQHHIRQRDNFWFQRLEHTIHDEMHGIDSYCYDWNYHLRRKKNMPICLILYLSPDFFQPVQAVRAVSSIFAFVRDESRVLRNMLLKNDERSAA